ncbi:LysM peptidoglycan-binding domain-containing protein [Chitinispirillales bacterium ANBcel5]|uniref:LysM peptidoglycan-binding domain-containing protein n=1 Tax=Cellulosispirillum alkaliphilum TaxID=3039283 RepID=UPI002A54395E|nr:LysM peptidoglycan-binding domain-containing protein [Chitinispirillales bacterium ANBcel5]
MFHEYVVQQGDTLAKIAKRYYGCSSYYKPLAEFNDLEDPDRIEPGQVLELANGFYTYEKVVREKEQPVICLARGESENCKAEGEMIFYAPGRDEYLIVEPSQVDALLVEVEELNDFAAQISQYRDTAIKGPIDETSSANAQELIKKTEEKFDGIAKDPSSAVQELLKVKDNWKWGTAGSRVYVRPHKLDGKAGVWYENNAQEVKELKDKWMKELDEQPREKEKVKTKLKATLWESEKIDTQWPWNWRFKNNAGSDTAVGYLSASYDTQFFRFVAGSRAGADFDLEDKKLSVGAESAVSFSLLEGTVKGQWSLPQEKGFSIYEYLLLSENARSAIKDGYDCRFRFSVKPEGKGFVGGSLKAAVTFPCIELGDEQKGSVGGSVGGFAGASVEGKFALALEWSKGVHAKFDTLAEAGKTLGKTLGAGFEAKAVFEYDGEVVSFETGIMATKGIGGKAGIAVEISVDKAIDLFSHLFESVEWHRVGAVASLTFEVFANVMFAKWITVGRVGKGIVDRVSNFGSWLVDRVDSVFGIRETKECIKRNTNQDMISHSPPETLGRVLKTVMASPEEDDFKTIEEILSSIKCKHQLKWTLRNVQDEYVITHPVSDRNRRLALEKGIERLLAFGMNLENHAKYKRSISLLTRKVY